MTEHVALSVMIPNFNYAKYIGETIESVRAGSPEGTEIVVCDNASTDDSVGVVRAFGDPRIRLAVNSCNVGFAANLERVASMARGHRMLLLSSDDRVRPGALVAYRALERALGADADRAVWGAATTVIDGDGKITGRMDPDPKLWRDAVVDPKLSAAVGYPVRAIPAAAMLRRALELLRSPLPFATTSYSRALHDAVGGYAGGRLMNPDKWFLWKLLAVAETVYAIDEPLFDYRIHGGGQAAIEQKSGALKHLTDQYVATFNLPDEVLARAELDRDALSRAFIEQDIALRGLAALADGKRTTARRGVDFGLATYPTLARANPKVWALRGLLAAGPVGTLIARGLRARLEHRWRVREARSRPTKP